QLIGKVLEGLEAAFANAGAASRQWIDIADLEVILRICRADEHRQHHCGSHEKFAHAWASSLICETIQRSLLIEIDKTIHNSANPKLTRLCSIDRPRR